MPKTSANRSVIQRPGFWAIVAAGLFLVAGAVITLLNRFMYSPESAVKDYVEALSDGDGATAMALSRAYLADDAPENISTILLDGQVLSQSAQLLKDADIVTVDAEVPEAFRDPGLTQRVVEIRYQDASEETRSTAIVVDKASTSWLFFNDWQLHPMPLQQIELVPSRMPEDSKADEPVAQVYGARTPLLGEEGNPAVLAAFAPSVIELEYHGTYLEAAKPEMYAVSDVLAPGATMEFGFDVELTSAVDETIHEEVQQQLQRCTNQTVLMPAGCPFGYETANRVVPESVSWVIDVPEVEYSWNDSEPEIDRIMATAELTAQEIDIGSGEQSTTDYQEAFELSADLELTPENLTVRPDWG